MSTPIISAFEAMILGIVEGVTEYLPVSSTGHLILTSEILGLHAKAGQNADAIVAIQAFEIVIQSGAILAVLILYRARVLQMIQGLLGRDAAGLKLFRNLCLAFIPTVVIGLAVKGLVRQYLQFAGPVIVGLAIGGVFMIAFGLRPSRFSAEGASIESISVRQALGIGFGQCLALWPGMSRSMVTISGGLFAGLSPLAATEFSFLLGLPTLLAATAYKAISDGPVLVAHIGPESIVVGLLTSAVFAALTVKWMVKHLNRLGFVWFGGYRLVVAAVMTLYFVLN